MRSSAHYLSINLSIRELQFIFDIPTASQRPPSSLGEQAHAMKNAFTIITRLRRIASRRTLYHTYLFMPTYILKITPLLHFSPSFYISLPFLRERNCVFPFPLLS